jgi:hypothetical protein
MTSPFSPDSLVAWQERNAASRRMADCLIEDTPERLSWVHVTGLWESASYTGPLLFRGGRMSVKGFFIF